jgi:hypothetical protein
MPLLFIPILRRAFASNPRLVKPTKHEEAKLEAAGVHQPVLRSYLAWRRGLILFTLVATILSTSLSTLREFTESEDRPDLVETISESIEEAADEALPGLQDKGEEEDDETPAAVEALPKKEPETKFGEFAEYVDLAAMYALQFAALIVLFVWSRWRLSFVIMAAAFVFSFVGPLLISFCPWSWWGYEDPVYSLEKEPLEWLHSTAEGLMEGAQYLAALLPTILSLVPAVQRACVRVKMLLPQSMLPGWFLVMASPFYALFLLVIFVALVQVDSHALLIGGFFLFLAAPLIYPFTAHYYTRPLDTDDDYQRIRNVQRVVGLVTAAAGGCFLIFMATQKVLGVHIVGTDPAHSLIVPLDLIEFALEILGRSMFVTALGADLFMRMNLAAWQNARAFAESGQTENYDKVMGELETIS